MTRDQDRTYDGSGLHHDNDKDSVSRDWGDDNDNGE